MIDGQTGARGIEREGRKHEGERSARAKAAKSFPLNLGKRGMSASVGVKGAHVTVGREGILKTISVPGAGVSFTHVHGSHHARTAAQGEEQPLAAASVSPVCIAVLVVALVGWVAYLITRPS